MKKYCRSCDYASEVANKTAFELQDNYFYFLLLAMFDIYSCKLEDDDPDVLSFLECGDPRYYGKIETKLAKKANRTEVSVTRNIEFGRQRNRCLNWKCNIEVQSDSTTNYSFSAPLVVSSCAYTRNFGDHRFLFVTADGNITRLMEGIQFAGSKYQFLGGELDDSSKLNCWFFSTSFTTRNGAKIYLPKSVCEARNWLADFESVETAFKCNARLKLGFSPTYPCFDLTDPDIILDDDIVSSSGGNSGIMTDGCGLIHSSLAEKIPYAISSGVSACERDSSLRREGLGLPLIVQIRLAAKKGLFKGCLIVTNDTSLCPAGKIVVRSSMKKASGAKHITHNTPCTLAVNSTFEHPLRIRHGYASTSYHANLSRQLCLYLVYLGVPQVRLEALMHDELDRVINAIHKKDAAKNLIMRSLERSEYAMQKNKINYDDEDEEDNGDDCEYGSHHPFTSSWDEVVPTVRNLSALHTRATDRYPNCHQHPFASDLTILYCVI